MNLCTAIKTLSRLINRIFDLLEMVLDPAPQPCDEACRQMRDLMSNNRFKEAYRMGKHALRLCSDREQRLDCEWEMIRVCRKLNNLDEAVQWFVRVFDADSVWIRQKITNSGEHGHRYRRHLETLLKRTRDYELERRLAALFMLEPYRTPEDERSLTALNETTADSSYQSDSKDPAEHEKAALRFGRMKLYGEAIEAWKRAIALESDARKQLYYKKLLAPIYVVWAFGFPQPNSRDHLLTQALSQASEITSLEPDDGYNYYLRGYVFHGMKDYGRAIDSYEQAGKSPRPYRSDGLECLRRHAVSKKSPPRCSHNCQECKERKGGDH